MSTVKKCRKLQFQSPKVVMSIILVSKILLVTQSMLVEALLETLQLIFFIIPPQLSFLQFHWLKGVTWRGDIFRILPPPALFVKKEGVSFTKLKIDFRKIFVKASLSQNLKNSGF